MARVSAPENQGKDSTKLLRYLMDHGHWSPLEMANACFEITTTRDIARQLLRHRSFSFQEFSQRYATVDKLETPPLREARLQDTANRQNSVVTDDENTQAICEYWQTEVLRVTGQAYQALLEEGIAKEVARAVLPEGLTTSRLYMNGTIRSWVHFLDLRCGNGTQKETQELAVAIKDALREFYPNLLGSV
jgi:thymidylate synthase (FAD)